MVEIPWDDTVESELEWAKYASNSTEALPHLRNAAAVLDSLINEHMSAALLSGNSIQNVAKLAGFTENAVGPRLARSDALQAYAREDGRVTASGITRAMYDRETGNKPPKKPMKFNPRTSRKGS